MFGFVVDYLTGKSYNLNLTAITSAIWHPRQAGRLLLGRTDGFVVLYDTNAKKQLMIYETPQPEEVKLNSQKISENQIRIVDVCFSPGEDVFLALRADGNLYLFG